MCLEMVNIEDEPIDEQWERWSKIIFSLILSSIGVLGLIGNTTVLIVAFRKKNYQSVTNCYIINLALTDLLFLAFSVPLTVYLSLTNQWIFEGDLTCLIHIFVAHVLLHVTCYTLSAMSVDRYLYVRSQSRNPTWRTPLTSFFVCFSIWILSIVSMFPYRSVISRLAKQENQSTDEPCSLSTNNSLLSCFYPLMIYYLIPLTIIVLFYSKLIVHVRRTSTNLLRHSRSSSSSLRPVTNTRRQRVHRTLFWLICAFACCWLPINLLEFLNCRLIIEPVYYSNRRFFDTIRLTAHALSYFNSCLNPFLYALYNRAFFL